MKISASTTFVITIATVVLTGQAAPGWYAALPAIASTSTSTVIAGEATPTAPAPLAPKLPPSKPETPPQKLNAPPSKRKVAPSKRGLPPVGDSHTIDQRDTAHVCDLNSQIVSQEECDERLPATGIV